MTSRRRVGWRRTFHASLLAATLALAAALRVHGIARDSLWGDEGDEKGALDLYIKAYDPSAPTARLRKGQIETLYRKVNGSLDGLEQKLQK